MNVQKRIKNIYFEFCCYKIKGMKFGFEIYFSSKYKMAYIDIFLIKYFIGITADWFPVD